MSAPLTDEELAAERRSIYTGTCGDPDCDCTPETCSISRQADRRTRLLDEHAALKRILDTRTLVMPGQCTEEERRILKTMAGVRNQTLIATLEKRAERPAWVLRLCEHELARREAERAKGGA